MIPAVFCRRVQELEEDLETTETKCQMAIVKLDKAATTADDSDRMAKVLQNRLDSFLFSKLSKRHFLLTHY